MKDFDFEAAKQGAAVCTRDGLPARIICFNAENPLFRIVAMIRNIATDMEFPQAYRKDGGWLPVNTICNQDLMMRDDDYKRRLAQGLYCSAPNDQNDAIAQPKRALIAAMAMQGIISGRDAFAIGTAIPNFSKQVAKSAVIFADDLIAELNKKEEGELDCANALLGNTVLCTPNCNSIRKKTVVTKFLRQILPPNAVLDYLDDVWDSEECENDPLDAILNNAWWWHSGGKNRQYHVDAMPVGDVTDDIYCVIYKDDKEIGNLTLAFDDAISIGLWNGKEGKK